MQTVDAPPEFVHYRDVGCDLHSACLTCPLPVCKEELKHGAASIRAHMRELQINLLRSEGRTVEWIAEVMGISVRTVCRLSASKGDDTMPLTDSSRHAKMSIAAHSVSTNGRDHARQA
ncbi:hypothetical protein LCGC14_2339010 [marine sediment metagenome]|uniref:Uncharacterized protein n=2 Tax=marine sediment metagenome TaxID=412755 RepID=A0A0F9D972_9ZZZZ